MRDDESNTNEVIGTVYLVQHPPPTQSGWTPDLTQAREFGRVKVLLRDGERASYRATPVLQRLISRLTPFRPDRDHILYAGGDPWSLVLVGIALQSLGFVSFRFLRYDRSPERDGSYRYVSVEVTLPPA